MFLNTGKIKQSSCKAEIGLYYKLTEQLKFGLKITCNRKKQRSFLYHSCKIGMPHVLQQFKNSKFMLPVSTWA